MSRRESKVRPKCKQHDVTIIDFWTLYILHSRQPREGVAHGGVTTASGGEVSSLPKVTFVIMVHVDLLLGKCHYISKSKAGKIAVHVLITAILKLLCK